MGFNIKRPGATHRMLNVPKGQKIPLEKIRAKLQDLHKKAQSGKLSKQELRQVHQLVFAKNAKTKFN